jgi:hypothetical protein
MRRTSLVFAALSMILAARPVSAQNWYDSIFPERSKDLGTVARGSKIRHSFKLVNNTSHDVHIASYTTKCGCTEVKIGARDIPPGTQTTIEALIDTTKFQGPKASGLTLIMDRPYPANVDLNLTCFIRGDVLLNPGVVDFQVTPRGSKPSVVLSLNYVGGVDNWAITKVHTISSHVTATVREVGRSTGSVQYQVTAALSPTAPSGHLKDEITLITTDPSSPSIPISVSANVQAAVSVSPAILTLGKVKAGQTVTKEVIVRSSQPFKIASLHAKKPDLNGVEATPSAAGAFHKVTLTFKAPNELGPYNTVLEVTPDLKDEPPAKLTVFATITP